MNNNFFFLILTIIVYCLYHAVRMWSGDPVKHPYSRSTSVISSYIVSNGTRYNDNISWIFFNWLVYNSFLSLTGLQTYNNRNGGF